MASSPRNKNLEDKFSSQKIFAAECKAETVLKKVYKKVLPPEEEEEPSSSSTKPSKNRKHAGKAASPKKAVAKAKSASSPKQPAASASSDRLKKSRNDREPHDSFGKGYIARSTSSNSKSDSTKAPSKKGYNAKEAIAKAKSKAAAKKAGKGSDKSNSTAKNTKSSDEKKDDKPPPVKEEVKQEVVQEPVKAEEAPKPEVVEQPQQQNEIVEQPQQQNEVVEQSAPPAQSEQQPQPQVQQPVHVNTVQHAPSASDGFYYPPNSYYGHQVLPASPGLAKQVKDNSQNYQPPVNEPSSPNHYAYPNYYQNMINRDGFVEMELPPDMLAAGYPPGEYIATRQSDGTFELEFVPDPVQQPVQKTVQSQGYGSALNQGASSSTGLPSKKGGSSFVPKGRATVGGTVSKRTSTSSSKGNTSTNSNAVKASNRSPNSSQKLESKKKVSQPVLAKKPNRHVVSQPPSSSRKVADKKVQPVQPKEVVPEPSIQIPPSIQHVEEQQVVEQQDVQQHLQEQQVVEQQDVQQNVIPTPPSASKKNVSRPPRPIRKNVSKPVPSTQPMPVPTTQPVAKREMSVISEAVSLRTVTKNMFMVSAGPSISREPSLQESANIHSLAAHSVGPEMTAKELETMTSVAPGSVAPNDLHFNSIYDTDRPVQGAPVRSVQLLQQLQKFGNQNLLKEKRAKEAVKELPKFTIGPSHGAHLYDGPSPFEYVYFHAAVSSKQIADRPHTNPALRSPSSPMPRRPHSGRPVNSKPNQRQRKHRRSQPQAKDLSPERKRLLEENWNTRFPSDGTSGIPNYDSLLDKKCRQTGKPATLKHVIETRKLTHEYMYVVRERFEQAGTDKLQPFKKIDSTPLQPLLLDQLHKSPAELAELEKGWKDIAMKFLNLPLVTHIDWANSSLHEQVLREMNHDPDQPLASTQNVSNSQGVENGDNVLIVDEQAKQLIKDECAVHPYGHNCEAYVHLLMVIDAAKAHRDGRFDLGDDADIDACWWSAVHGAEMLWEELSLAEIHKDQGRCLMQTMSTKSMHKLLLFCASLLNFRQATLEITKLIVERESTLQRIMTIDVISVEDPNLALLVHHCVDLDEITEMLVRCIRAWTDRFGHLAADPRAQADICRQHAEQNGGKKKSDVGVKKCRPVFVWGGRDYLEKVLADIEALRVMASADHALCEKLGIPKVGVYVAQVLGEAHFGVTDALHDLLAPIWYEPGVAEAGRKAMMDKGQPVRPKFRKAAA